MSNAQLNDALVIGVASQLARIALKKMANHKSTEMKPQTPSAELVEKMHEEGNIRTHFDVHEIKTNSNFSHSIGNLSTEIDNLTGDGFKSTERDIAYEINLVQHKNSNDRVFKGEQLILNFYKRCSRPRHSISTCLDVGHTKPLD